MKGTFYFLVGCLIGLSSTFAFAQRQLRAAEKAEIRTLLYDLHFTYFEDQQIMVPDLQKFAERYQIWKDQEIPPRIAGLYEMFRVENNNGLLKTYTEKTGSVPLVDNRIVLMTCEPTGFPDIQKIEIIARFDGTIAVFETSGGKRQLVSSSAEGTTTLGNWKHKRFELSREKDSRIRNLGPQNGNRTLDFWFQGQTQVNGRMRDISPAQGCVEHHPILSEVKWDELDSEEMDRMLREYIGKLQPRGKDLARSNSDARASRANP